MSIKEQNRLHILNGVLGRNWSMGEAALLLGVSERQGWRLLAAYRKDGAAALAHQNRGRVPPNATPEAIQRRVVALAQEQYGGINHTHLTELLAEREGVMLSRPTVRRLLVRAGLSSPRHRRATGVAGNGCPRRGCCSSWTAAIMPGWKTGDPGWCCCWDGASCLIPGTGGYPRLSVPISGHH